jgi:pSer/pThr/pTyr-binding forkhead associated (FHA) protein
MWVLEAHTSDSEGTEPIVFRMPDGAIKTVGRSTGAEFILQAPLVSRLHCRLTATEPGLEVIDLDSTNGTFVNGVPIKKAVLKPGDTLKVGRVELVVSRV